MRTIFIVALVQIFLLPVAARCNSTDDQRCDVPHLGSEQVLDLGMKLVPLSDLTAQRLGLKRGTPGVVIIFVNPKGSASSAGLLRGDVILEADHCPVYSSYTLYDRVREAGTRPVLLMINRDGWKFFVTLHGV